MPLWLVYHPPETTFTTPESKAALAADITSIYTDVVGLPAFYVVVEFIAVPGSSTFVGGKARDSSSDGKPPFVRITVDHIARRNVTGDPAVWRRTTERLDAVLRPHTKDKGYDYEFHADETPQGLWAINGLAAPEGGSEGEKLWAREGRAVPYEHFDVA